MPKGPATRATDKHLCPAPLKSGTGPHGGGVITAAGARTVFINQLPAAVQGDTCVCPDPTPPNSIVSGSMRVNVNGLPAARQFDPTLHGGKVGPGSPNVYIGD